MEVRVNWTPEGDLQSQIDRLTKENERLRDRNLEQWGTLACIREWLRGDLPEATKVQFIAMIEALESEAE